MRHEFDVQLDLSRLTRNSRHLMFRRVWKPLLAIVILMFLLMLLMFDPLWALIGGLIVAGVLAVFAHILFSRRASAINTRWRTMTGGELHITATEEALRVEHDAGLMQMRWHALGPIVKLGDDWVLLTWSGQSYVPLPVEQVPEDALLFIESEVTAHGARDAPAAAS